MFTAEQRRRIVEHRMREVGVATIAELARRASCDKANLARTIDGQRPGISASARARVALVLDVDQEILAQLLGCDTIAVPVGIWRELVGEGQRRQRAADDAAEQREKQQGESRHNPVPGKSWRSKGKAVAKPSCL
jgi:hypothetical protein